MQEDQSRYDAEKAASYDILLNLLKEKVDKASTSSAFIIGQSELYKNLLM